MPGILAWSYAETEAVLAALAVVAIALLALIGYRAWKNAHITPLERERRRRAQLTAHGKLGDAVLVEVSQSLLVFTYDVRGMEYTASQDVSALQEWLPPELSSLNSVAVRYLPENPANSIVVAEEWSGLRAGRIRTPQSSERMP
jgi:hypothetical protein